MIIDSHEHVILPVDKQIEILDKANIDKAILFSTTPHPEKANTYSELKEETFKLYKILSGANTKAENMQRMRTANEELLKSIKSFPNRFFGFGATPLGLSINETKEWVEKCIEANGFKGVGEYTPGCIDQIKQLETVFKALQEFNKLPIWIHTFNPVTLEGIKELISLVKRYPTVKVIFGHGAGSNWQTLLDFAKCVDNAYIDTSASFSTLATKMMMKELPQKCLFSSDAPYGDPFMSRKLIEYLSDSKVTTDMVMGGNISKLLKL